MAIKARAEVTLSSIKDVASTTRYYLLQSSTAAAPSKPTTNPPTGNWVKYEPSYTENSTNSLYFVDLTVFSDDSFAYSDVSLSSSYEAAKAAYNKALSAENVANALPAKIPSTNISPFFSHNLDDVYDETTNPTGYWSTRFDNFTSCIFEYEQLEDGWLHVHMDNSSGSSAVVHYCVAVRYNPVVKMSSLYTILWEFRNKVVTAEHNNSYLYISQVNNSSFWGGNVSGRETERLEGTTDNASGNGSVVNIADIPSDGSYAYMRSTKISEPDPDIDDSSHIGDKRIMIRFAFRIGAGHTYDVDVRLSMYEGTYWGQYVPYVVSDTSALRLATEKAQNDIDSLEVGGRNLLLDTSSSEAVTMTGGDSLKLTKNWLMSDYGKSLANNTTQTFTLTARYTITGSGASVGEGAYIRGQVCNTVSGSNSSTDYITDGIEYPTGLSGIYKKTFKLSSAQAAYATPNIRFSLNYITGTVTFDNVKLELGNKATDWTIAPEDVENTIENIQVGGRNLLLNSSFESNLNSWENVSNGTTNNSITTEDGYTCCHVVGEISKTKFVGQSIFNKIKDDDYTSQVYTVSADIKLVNYVAGTTNPYVALYFSGTYDNNGTSTFLGATRVGGSVGTSSNNLPPFNNIGWKRVTYTMKFLQQPTTMKFSVYARDFTGDLYFKNVKFERGNKATDWSPASEDLEDSITLVSNNLTDYINSTEIVVGTQTAATGSWTGNAGFNTLNDGQQIAYWLPYAGSGSATLNLTLANGNTTGAINVYYRGTTRATTHFAAGSVIHLTYRVNANVSGTTATGWWADASYDSGNNYDRIKYSNNVTAKSNITKNTFNVSDDSGYFKLAGVSVFDITKPIVWAAGDITAGKTGNNNYIAIPSCTLRNNASGISLTANQTCYLVGTLSGKNFTVKSSGFFTSTVPTTDDGYYYIAFGFLYSAYQVYFYPEHPIYKFVNGTFMNLNQLSYEALIAANAVTISASSDSFIKYEFNNAMDYYPSSITLTPTFSGKVKYSKWQYKKLNANSWTDVTSSTNGVSVNATTGVLTLSKSSTLYNSTLGDNYCSAIVFKCLSDNVNYFAEKTITHGDDPTTVFSKLNTSINQTNDNISLIASSTELQNYTTSQTLSSKVASTSIEADKILMTVGQCVNNLSNANGIKGVYDDSVAYAKDNVVVHDGKFYKAKSATTGNKPPNTTYWNDVSSTYTESAIKSAFSSIVALQDSITLTVSGAASGSNSTINLSNGTLSMSADDVVNIIAGKRLTLNSGGTLEIRGEGGVAIGTSEQGAITIESPNFTLNKNGEINSSSGILAGWAITNDQLVKRKLTMGDYGNECEHDINLVQWGDYFIHRVGDRVVYNLSLTANNNNTETTVQYDEYECLQDHYNSQISQASFTADVNRGYWQKIKTHTYTYNCSCDDYTDNLIELNSQYQLIRIKKINDQSKFGIYGTSDECTIAVDKINFFHNYNNNNNYDVYTDYSLGSIYSTRDTFSIRSENDIEFWIGTKQFNLGSHSIGNNTTITDAIYNLQIGKIDTNNAVITGSDMNVVSHIYSKMNTYDCNYSIFRYRASAGGTPDNSDGMAIGLLWANDGDAAVYAFSNTKHIWLRRRISGSWGNWEQIV